VPTADCDVPTEPPVGVEEEEVECGGELSKTPAAAAPMIKITTAASSNVVVRFVPRTPPISKVKLLCRPPPQIPESITDPLCGYPKKIVGGFPDKLCPGVPPHRACRDTPTMENAVGRLLDGIGRLAASKGRPLQLCSSTPVSAPSHTRRTLWPKRPKSRGAKYAFAYLNNVALTSDGLSLVTRLMGFGLCILGGFLIGYVEGIQSIIVEANRIVLATGATLNMPLFDVVVGAFVTQFVQGHGNQNYGSFWAFGIILAFLGFVLVAKGDRKPPTAEDLAPLLQRPLGEEQE
jgi:hypothetical protein